MNTKKIRSGLCSVTFRELSVTQIVDLAAGAGIEAVEWGGDVHVPPGDLVAARDASARCGNVGIECASYGSYLFAGHEGPDDTARLVETALALGVPNVRVWCPFGLLPGTGGPDRKRAVDSLRAVSAVAGEAGLDVSLEFHAGTLTQTAESTLVLLDEVGAPNLFAYWQPMTGVPVPALLGELEHVLPRLSHLHVFAWDADGTRLPLSAGADLWTEALGLAGAAEAHGSWTGARVAFLEFVEGDEPEAFLRDAHVLRDWLARI